MNKIEALKESISIATVVIDKYKEVLKYPFLSYCCEPFIMHIITSEKIQIDSFPFRNKDFCGMLCIDEHETTIAYNADHPQYRRNFTLAHELGHYFLHSGKQTQFADRSKNLLDSTNSIMEMQANAFAAHVIIPKNILFYMLKNKFTFYKIAKVTRVSYDALFWIITNHLTAEYKISRNDAILITEDYKDFSTGSHKNLVHHNFSMIYKLNKNNYKSIIEDLRNGKRPYDFERNLNGDIIAVK